MFQEIKAHKLKPNHIIIGILAQAKIKKVKPIKNGTFQHVYLQENCAPILFKSNDLVKIKTPPGIVGGVGGKLNLIKLD